MSFQSFYLLNELRIHDWHRQNVPKDVTIGDEEHDDCLDRIDASQITMLGLSRADQSIPVSFYGKRRENLISC